MKAMMKQYLRYKYLKITNTKSQNHKQLLSQTQNENSQDKENSR